MTKKTIPEYLEDERQKDVLAVAALRSSFLLQDTSFRRGA